MGMGSAIWIISISDTETSNPVGALSSSFNSPEILIEDSIVNFSAFSNSSAFLLLEITHCIMSDSSLKTIKTNLFDALCLYTQPLKYTLVKSFFRASSMVVYFDSFIFLIEMSFFDLIMN
ncbi:hypothetical protein ES708_30957 [subsurface metagenome]